MRLIVIGGALLVAAWLVVLLMVIGLIRPSLLLSMGAYAASVAGLVVGLFGVTLHLRERARREESPRSRQENHRKGRGSRAPE